MDPREIEQHRRKSDRTGDHDRSGKGSKSGKKGIKSKEGPQRAGSILKSLLDAEQNEKAQNYYRFFSAWDHIVGENLAGRTRAVEIKGKTLIVEVDHPGWIQLLDIRKAHILHQLRKQFPGLAIEKIRYYIAGEDYGAHNGNAPPPEDENGAVENDRKSDKAFGRQRPSDSEGSEVYEDFEESEAPEVSEDSEASKNAEDPEKKRLDSLLDMLGNHIEGNENGS